MLLVHIPPPPLRAAVSSAVGYRSGPFPAGVHRGLPSRNLTLAVELLDRLTVRGLGRAVAAHGVLGGLHTEPAIIDATRTQEGLQYGLSPIVAQRLLGVSAAELRGYAVDLADILGGDAARLLEQIQAAPDWNERFRLLDDALIRRLDGTPSAAPPEVVEAWRMILASDGRASVAEVAAHVGWGRRHLSERFRQTTGLTPKETARIARFEAAQRLLRTAAAVRLVDVAARCGYADQSHLAREWRSLSGDSIGTWMREELPFLQDTAGTEAADSVP